MDLRARSRPSTPRSSMRAAAATRASRRRCGRRAGAAEPEPSVVDAAREQASSHWERHGFGTVAAARPRQRRAGRPRRAAAHRTSPARDEVEVGWAIVPERWGEGLATELALARRSRPRSATLGLPRVDRVHAARQPRLAAGDGEGRLHLRARRHPRRAAARALPSRPAATHGAADAVRARLLGRVCAQARTPL